VGATAERYGSAYQRLVERYIDIASWPTSKKAAALMVGVLPFHLAAIALMRLLREGLRDVVDVARIEALFGAWLAAVVLLVFVTVPFARRAKEARWTIYLVIGVYGAFVCIYAQFMGLMTGPYPFFGSLIVLLLTLFVDARAGLVGFLAYVGLTAVVVGFELTGKLPLAPAVTARTLDDLFTPAWVSLHGVVVLMVSAFVFGLLQLSQSAREAQQMRLDEARERLERGTELIRRYVPVQLAEKILAGEHSGTQRPERRKLTLFFSDVVEFTQASDRMEPEDLSDLLNEYLAEMAAIADTAGATVNQSVGDGIMIFFGAPESTSDRDHAVRAVRMALAMQDRMSLLREQWFARGIQTPFQIRIGVNTGVASVGDFGSEGRTTYSAVGTQTNLTARIQDKCEPGRILISHTTWALVQGQIQCEARGEIEVKGLHFPIKVYEVLDEQLDPTME
jgi:adenylate cyclase